MSLLTLHALSLPFYLSHLCLNMNEPNNSVPGEGRVDRLIRLRSQGLTVQEAAGQSGISVRQAYRILARSAPDRDMTERWSPSDAGAEDPEKVSYLFDTMAAGRWTRQEAEIAWPVHCANPQLPPSMVRAFCQLYVVAARSSDEDQTRRRKLVIDWVLLYEPWTDEQALEEFIDAVPVLSKDEVGYAASVVKYLRKFIPVETDSERRVYVQAVLGVDRHEHFKLETERIEREEQQQRERLPDGQLMAVQVPGEERRRTKYRNRRTLGRRFGKVEKK